MSKHTEAAFEQAIEASLVSRGGYERRKPKQFDEAMALFPDDVIGFIQDSQPARWAQIVSVLKDEAPTIVLDALCKELNLKGTLHVLRHGFKCYGKSLRLAYFRPNSGMNPQSAQRYEANRLTITRQVAFASVKKQLGGGHRRCVIDVTLAVNGLPVVTAELKNPMTGQRAADAITQYKRDRDGRDLLFQFKKRALVHFAVDPDEAWMTTRLRDGDTFFLPFNKGHGHRAGNPPVADDWRTHYLWDEVLSAESLLDILQRFMHLEVVEKKVRTDAGVRTVRKETMIFPRYHQLDAVRSLVAHSGKQGAGHNYLVQHSAGSGKSNSIAWLAHRLATLHDGSDEKVFHSVVVVTDRRVLDQQLQDTIYQFEHKTGVVEKIDKDTQQLAQALSGGTPIIITTIQKFPFIAQALDTLEKKGEGVKIDTAGKRFAVIVDEAHSSQSGETAQALKGLLNKDGIAAAVASQLAGDDDERIPDEEAAALRAAMRRNRQPNLSFFAFTATPKYKTKVLFDEPGADGRSPFHHYSMRQAIDEGFIMDVLANYTTYKRYYGLIKQAEADPEVPKRKAAKALTSYVNLHPVNIEQVVSVIVEHFRLHVMHEMGGRAKAMVVTGTRLMAVKYKLALDEYIRKNGYSGIRSLVAFSGTVEDPDDPDPESSFTEVGMNDGISESELPEVFSGEEYRVLIVADKYQTGFDQPLLQTMYVVKRLAGVQAVQTLSRLNRMATGKSRTFVLDFVNGAEEVFEAFKPYFETTEIEGEIDPQRLNELQHKLLEWAIFSPEDVQRFCEIWYRGRRQTTGRENQGLNAILDQVVSAFSGRADEEQESIRGQLGAYRNLYAFLSQVIPYADSELERLYVFVRKLLSKLPPPGDGTNFTLDDEVSLKYFRLQQISEGSIDLTAGEGYPLKGPTDTGTAGVRDEEVSLSSLVEKLNERFGTDFTEADQLFFDQISASAALDDRIAEAARANTLSNFSEFLGRSLDELFIARMEGNEDIFARLMEDSSFRKAAQEHLAHELYLRLKR